jgi:hypothetical protein
LLTTVASTTAITIHRTTFFARSFNSLTSDHGPGLAARP